MFFLMYTWHLFPVTRHNKELVEVQPWTADQLYTLQHLPHTCIHKGRTLKSHECTRPYKNIRGYEACSKKDGLVESSATDCWSMSPSNVTSNTASKSNWRWPGARTGGTGWSARGDLFSYNKHLAIYSLFIFYTFNTLTLKKHHSIIQCQSKAVRHNHGNSHWNCLVYWNTKIFRSQSRY